MTVNSATFGGGECKYCIRTTNGFSQLTWLCLCKLIVLWHYAFVCSGIRKKDEKHQKVKNESSSTRGVCLIGFICILSFDLPILIVSFPLFNYLTAMTVMTDDNSINKNQFICQFVLCHLFCLHLIRHLISQTGNCMFDLKFDVIHRHMGEYNFRRKLQINKKATN